MVFNIGVPGNYQLDQFDSWSPLASLVLSPIIVSSQTKIPLSRQYNTTMPTMQRRSSTPSLLDKRRVSDMPPPRPRPSAVVVPRPMAIGSSHICNDFIQTTTSPVVVVPSVQVFAESVPSALIRNDSIPLSSRELYRSPSIVLGRAKPSKLRKNELKRQRPAASMLITPPLSPQSNTAIGSLDAIVELVLQNSEDDGRRHAAASDPRTFSQCLRVLCDRKSRLGHVVMDCEKDPELYDWVCHVQQELQRSNKGESLSTTSQRTSPQQIWLVQQLGLAHELFGTTSCHKRRRTDQSPPVPEWTRYFIKYIIDSESKVTTPDAHDQRAKWIRQQRVEYWALKATSQDPFSNLQANFRYQLLMSCGINMDVK